MVKERTGNGLWNPDDAMDRNDFGAQIVKQPTVFLLENDCSTRVSITEILHRQRISVRAFSEPGAFFQNYDANVANCLLLALRVAATDGIAVAKQLAMEGYCPPFIMISDEAGITDVTQAMKSGAMDFMEKPLDGQQLVTHIHQAFDEDKRRRCDRARRSSVRSRLQSLSSREHEVLTLVMAGCLTKQIAKQLNISIKTVEAHRSNIVRKMHVGSFLQVAHLVAIEQTSGEGTPLPAVANSPLS